MKNLFLLLFSLFALSTYSQEICDNGIDDDLDGLIDLNDTIDCDCGEVLPVESLIPNHSFEDRSCCPSGFSQLYCADDWEQASEATSDYFSTCGTFDGYTGGIDPMFPLPGDPGGEGFAGFIVWGTGYVEYVGTADLETPLLAGTEYALNLWTAWSLGNTTLDFSIFGSPNAADLPWDGFLCPDGTDDWELLAELEVIYTPDGAWQEITLIFTPDVDIYAIAIGGPCDPGGTFNYYYIDELTLLDYEGLYGLERDGGWCSGDLTLTGLTDTTGGTWQWYKDGVALLGENDEVLSPIPYGEGEFTARYSIGDFCKQVSYIPPGPIDVTFDVFSSCFPSTTEFTNTTADFEPDEVDWEWDFGDGDFSDEVSPDHIYGLGGTYDVVLIGHSDDSTCNDTTELSVFVAPKPIAAFDFSGLGMFEWAGHDVACANNIINFVDESTVDLPSDIVEWLWYFGDGTTSTEENPSYAFTDPGIYDVSLVVTTESGCSDSIAYEELYITAIYPDFMIENGCALDELNFENTSTLVTPGDFDLWEWDYGDGDFGVTEDGIHTYADPGTYTVELLAITESGCRDSIEHIVEVYPVPNAHFEFIVDGVSSEAGGTGGCYTSEVQFNSLAIIDAPSIITSWAWVFGDGETSTEENPSHFYDEEGLYTVELTVVSDFGCESNITLDIIMTNGLAFVSNDTTICQNGIATVYVESSDGGIYSYDWSIPGSDDSDSQTLTDLVDDYWVYVTSTSEFGCVSPMDSILITVLDPITLNITPFDTACIGEASGATVTVSGGRGDYSYEWTANALPMPDNAPTIITNPSTITEYCVTVSDGCETDPVSICTETYVPQIPVFTSDTTEGCEPTAIEFTDLTGPDVALNESTWYMDGEVLTGNPVTHLFEEAGTYTVKLDVLSPEGCVTGNSINNYITIHPLPEPQLYATPQSTTFFNTLVTAANINPNIASSFLWHTPGAYPEWVASDSTIEILYPELVSGIYTITLIETTQYGCVDSAFTTVEITNDQIIYAPNAFTPDGDALNQTWGIHIEGIDIYDFHLTLFNRWGEMIWESYDPTGNWDGMYGGELVQDGVYVWVVQAKDVENDKAYEFKGMVTVLK